MQRKEVLTQLTRSAYEEILEAERAMFRDSFDLAIELSSFLAQGIPQVVCGFDHLLIYPEELSDRRLLKFEQQYPVSWEKGDPQPSFIPEAEQRDIERLGSYAIWHKGGWEADSRSRPTIRQAVERKISSMTMRERRLYGAKRWIETGGHIDQTGVTLCAGSADTDGSTPGIGWYKERVYWMSFGDLGREYEALGIREVYLATSKLQR